MGQLDTTIKFPFGDADTAALTAAGEQDLTIRNTCTIIDGQTVSGTADRTIVLTIDPELMAGSKILLKAKVTGGTFNIIFGNGIKGPNIVGVDGKTKSQAFTFDGLNFLPDGAAVQID